MKKIILGSVLLAASLSASAFTSTPYMGPTLVEQDLTTPDSNFRGTLPRLSLGYMGAIDCYYLAGEVFVSPFTLTFSNNHPLAEPSLKISRDYGLSFIPGILLTEELISYLRLGFVKSKFKDLNMTKTGLQVGIGLQTSLTSSWSLRGEYIYTNYASINENNVGTPRSDEIGIGLLYKFDNS